MKRSGRRGLYAALGSWAGRAGMALLAAGAVGAAVGSLAGCSGNGARGVKLSDAPLGVNTAPWDSGFAGDSATRVQPLLKATGIGMLRYGGGSYADNYGWRDNTNVNACPEGGPAAVSAELGSGGCATLDALDFRAFSGQAAAIGARPFVTVNYGTGVPADAAAEVSAARSMPGSRAPLWEVGNEAYGCWEANNWLAQPPANYPGYVPKGQAESVNPTCPQQTQGDAAGTQTLADSYAANARPFMTAMRTADPTAEIGVPWAFGTDVAGAGVPASTEWNDTVLAADANDISFVDAHYYPFSFSGGTLGGPDGAPHSGIPSDSQILRSLFRIPALYGQIRSTLDKYAPKAGVVVGETNVSSAPTIAGCTHVGGLFAAGDALSWLAAGARSVDWWDANSYGDVGGGCSKPDFGMFTSPSHVGAADQIPESPFYGYQIASVLARPGATLSTLSTSDPADVLAFTSVLPGSTNGNGNGNRNGNRTAVAFLNTDTSAAKKVTFQAPEGIAGARTLTKLSYSPASPVVVTGTESAGTTPAGTTPAGTGSAGTGSAGTESARDATAGSITLPPESMTVLETP